MEELKRFLNDKGILKEYLQCISDERTNQGGGGVEDIDISDALTSFHIWSYSEDIFPSISEEAWINYHEEWCDIAPEGTIESREWLITQLSSKKLRLLNAIKDFR